MEALIQEDGEYMHTTNYLETFIEVAEDQGNRILLRKDLEQIVSIPTTTQTFSFDANFK